MTDLPVLDRVDVMVAAMAALLADNAEAAGDTDAVGIARIRCAAPGMVAGVQVMKEVFGRMGARVRVVAVDGSVLETGDVVAEMGGPLAAIGGASPTAIRFLTRLSALASGVGEPDPADPIEIWAVEIGRLSRVAPVGDAGPSFELEVHP
jgi:quinolinate phosphoribosyl transferase-like protein